MAKSVEYEYTIEEFPGLARPFHVKYRKASWKRGPILSSVHLTRAEADEAVARRLGAAPQAGTAHVKDAKIPQRLLARLVIIAHETDDPEIDRWARQLLRLHLDAAPQPVAPPEEDLGPELPFGEGLPVAEIATAALSNEAETRPKWKPVPPSKDTPPWPDETDEILKSIRWVRKDGQEVDLIEPLLHGDRRPLELVWKRLPGERWRGDRALDSKIVRLRYRIQKAAAKLEAGFNTGLDTQQLNVTPEDLGSTYEQARQIPYEPPSAVEPAGEGEAISVGETPEILEPAIQEAPESSGEAVETPSAGMAPTPWWESGVKLGWGSSSRRGWESPTVAETAGEAGQAVPDAPSLITESLTQAVPEYPVLAADKAELPAEPVEPARPAQELWDRSVALERERLADIKEQLQQRQKSRLGRGQLISQLP